MFSFRPTKNFEFGFERTVIWGGEGHAPVTLHTFLKSFFSFTDTPGSVKVSREDPGARYSDFTFSYRLPFLRRYATLYLDSIAHDDVTPISAPRRAAYRTGLYVSQIPGLRKLDVRAEGVTTDPGVARSFAGQFNYWEVIQKEGYTNKGFIRGDWIGREAKGGQAWLTYHLSADQWIQLEYLHKKTAKDFVPEGTTQNQFKASLDRHWAYLVYAGLWWEPLRSDLDAYMEEANSQVTGTIGLQLYKGGARVVTRSSPNAVYDADLASFAESGGLFSQTASPGFIELWSLQSRMAHRIRQRGEEEEQ